MRPICLIAVLSTALAAACSGPAGAPEPVRAVRTVTVATDTTATTVEYAAEVRARTESRLGFRVAGKLTERRAELGQHVRNGQALASLDASDLLLAEQGASAAARAAQTQYELAAAEFKRFQGLQAQGFISAWELERRETALRATRAQADQARAQAEAMQNQAGYALLRAPAAGVVTGVDAEPGAVLQAGAPVIRLALDGPRDAVFAVPEDAAPSLRALAGKPGALVVRPWADRGASIKATVREVAAAADPVTRTFLVKADLGAAAVQLGQTVTVVLQGTPHAALRLPSTAVMQHEGRNAVWVLDGSSMTVKVQPIAVSGADGNDVIVGSGLSPGTRVVTAGVHVLTPGQKVKLYREMPPLAGLAASR